MALDKFIYLNSVDTSYFYNDEEKYIHSRLLKLYSLRKKIKEQKRRNKWKYSCVNRVIAKEKEKLVKLLNNQVENKSYRKLDEKLLTTKNVINLFESSLTRALEIKPKQYTEDLFIVNIYFFQVFENLVKQGFEYKGENYIFLTASAGQIRTKKAVFIKQKSFDRIKPKIMCGLTIDKINELGGISINKFLAYLALSNSATEIWEDFDIDKTIVVEDWENEIEEEFDYIDYQTFEITRKKLKVNIPHTDGFGIIQSGISRMIRLPFIKGYVCQFDFQRFLKEKVPSDKWVVKDIYGIKHNIITEDIRCILTKSQFKLWKYFKSWEQYKNNFKAYGCEACYCNMEDNYIPKARINYQMLQTLPDITEEEIDRLIKPTKEDIENIGQDFRTTMRLLDATKENKNPSYMQRALILYPSLIKDEYNRRILKQTKKSYVKKARGGKLKVNGKYLFVAPDCYAWCEHLFLGEEYPKGLLSKNEVYTNNFSNNSELDVLRSPHLSKEHCIRINKRNEETNKWFGNTQAIHTSCFDSISKILQFD